jgi:hypothetical protein
MRTTLDIADDVLAAAKERARREGKTAGEVISELARRGLVQGSSPRPSEIREPRAAYGFRPFAKRGGVVTNELIDRIREDDAY